MSEPDTKPDWGHGPNAPVLMFTEEQIRAVGAEHYPSGRGGFDEIACGCSPKWVPRTQCYYCKAKVPPDAPANTVHKDTCRTKVMGAGTLEMGVMRHEFIDFTIEHFIEKLREAHG